MAYSDFTLQQIKTEFGISNQFTSLFKNVPQLEPSDWLKMTLAKSAKIHARTEKAKSEAIVFPILLEVIENNQDFITVYSGDTLVGDDETGLRGECDFIISKDTRSFDINYPVLQVVEAKKHDLGLGIPQCSAQMIGAKLYNEKNNTPQNVIFGCVTTGNEWQFMKLENQIIWIDNQIYYLNKIDDILGVFQQIINIYK